MFVNPPHHARAGLNEPSQQMLLPQDIGVISQVGCRRHGVRQRRQIGEPADGFELISVLEPLLDREQVNRLLVVVHLDQQLVQVPVAQIVKHLRTGLEFLDADVGGQQYAPEHALLGLDRMRRQAVHREGAGFRRSLPARLFQIRRRAAGIRFDGINHGPEQTRNFSEQQTRLIFG